MAKMDFKGMFQPFPKDFFLFHDMKYDVGSLPTLVGLKNPLEWKVLTY